jgi:hypothetical protein
MAAPLSSNLAWPLANPLWAAAINPVLANPINQGLLIQSISLISGNTTIAHGLLRMQQGWIIVDQNGAAEIYRSKSFNPLTLTLNSSAAVTVSLWVF